MDRRLKGLALALNIGHAVSMRLSKALLTGVLLLASCDKSASRSSQAVDALPTSAEKPLAEKGSASAPVEAQPEDEEEPTALNREEDAEGQKAGAQELQMSQPQFDPSAPAEFKKGFESFVSWVEAKGGKVYSALVDLETNKWLLREKASTAVNPASNAKLITAGAALELLGPAHQFKTELFGRIDEKGACKTLVLRGGGAPDLTTPDLWRILRVAVSQGLKRVESLVVDQSRFSEAFVPPAFEQQPKEWAPFRAPISALSINANTVTLNVLPTRDGQAARSWYDPPGILEEAGRVKTSKKGAGDRVSWALDVKKEAQRPRSKIGGQLAEGSGRRRYSRRLADPRLAPGLALAALLKESGVEVVGEPRLGKRAKEPRLALWKSEPVAEIVRAMGKDSDNFTAEMLLVALSGVDEEKKREKPWSSARGVSVVEKWLRDKNISMEGIVIKNGSGLFDANRLTAELIVKVLASLEDNPRIYQEFVSQLATGATDGTLRKRMRGGPLGPRVRAKTGTLRHVDALSGYIQRTGGRSPAAFSLIVVGPKTSHSSVRAKVDKLVLGWVKALQ